ncbi:Capsular synthesis regulator component B [Collimonas arenae]|uniref:Capsular synthesis regulator component B n=1 Tax=Collimonas arenae TaxID=279058 RepID=A0A0A1FK13_9BURK|nr:response regulator transcription factor [Collimonas arenae]AIY44075.1 Capsular synthesis regulator component B [Collimonas arenae]
MKIVLADDHPVFTAGVRDYLDRVPDCRVIACVTSADDLVRCLESTPCDLIITEFSMPTTRVSDGLHLLSYIRRHHPQTWQIVLSMNAFPVVLQQIINSGVNGLLHKSDAIPELGKNIRQLGSDTPYVSPSFQAMLQVEVEEQGKYRVPSPRETEVLRLYAAGNTLHDIARRLSKSVKTVSLQKAAAMKKMGLRNDIELGRYCATFTGDVIQPHGHGDWFLPELACGKQAAGH